MSKVFTCPSIRSIKSFLLEKMNRYLLTTIKFRLNNKYSNFHTSLNSMKLWNFSSFFFPIRYLNALCSFFLCRKCLLTVVLVIRGLSSRQLNRARCHAAKNHYWATLFATVFRRKSNTIVHIIWRSIRSIFKKNKTNIRTRKFLMLSALWSFVCFNMQARW